MHYKVNVINPTNLTNLSDLTSEFRETSTVHTNIVASIPPKLVSNGHHHSIPSTLLKILSAQIKDFIGSRVLYSVQDRICNLKHCGYRSGVYHSTLRIVLTLALVSDCYHGLFTNVEIVFNSVLLHVAI